MTAQRDGEKSRLDVIGQALGNLAQKAKPGTRFLGFSYNGRASMAGPAWLGSDEASKVISQASGFTARSEGHFSDRAEALTGGRLSESEIDDRMYESSAHLDALGLELQIALEAIANEKKKRPESESRAFSILLSGDGDFMISDRTLSLVIARAKELGVPIHGAFVGKPFGSGAFDHGDLSGDLSRTRGFMRLVNETGGSVTTIGPSENLNEKVSALAQVLFSQPTSGSRIVERAVTDEKTEAAKPLRVSGLSVGHIGAETMVCPGGAVVQLQGTAHYAIEERVESQTGKLSKALSLSATAWLQNRIPFEGADEIIESGIYGDVAMSISRPNPALRNQSNRFLLASAGVSSLSCSSSGDALLGEGGSHSYQALGVQAGVVSTGQGDLGVLLMSANEFGLVSKQGLDLWGGIGPIAVLTLTDESPDDSRGFRLGGLAMGGASLPVSDRILMGAQAEVFCAQASSRSDWDLNASLRLGGSYRLFSGEAASSTESK